MRAFQEDRKLKRRILSRPVLWTLFALAVLIAASALRVSKRAYVAREARQKTEEGLKKLAEEKSELEARISRLERPAGIEKEAKERFNIKSPGEEVIVILEAPTAISSSSRGSYGRELWRAFLELFK